MSKKIPLADLPNKARLPTKVSGVGDPLPVDVVEVGLFTRYVAPGDRIAAESDPTDGATLGIFATDNATKAALAITAMHAVPGVTSYPPVDGGGGDIAFLVGAATGNANLGRLLRGTMDGIDAAAIQLDAGQNVSRAIDGIGEVKYWRAVDSANDIGAPVKMRGAKTAQVVYGVIQQPTAYLPDQNLGPAIAVAISAQPGDSGAALLDHDGFLLGLLVGGSSTTQFFSPIGNIFNTLDCDLY